jgi:putative transposase
MKQLHSPRELRGLEISSQPDTIREVKKNVWMVKSQSGNGEYQVRKFTKGPRYTWECTCPDYLYRKSFCKHIYSVQFSLKIRRDVEQASTPKVLEDAQSVIVCPVCLSRDVIRRGLRKTTFGNIQRYGCLGCGHRFTVDKGFRNMKHDPKVITLTLDLYFKGVSLRKIADHLTQFYGVAVCQTTPMRWIRKYIKLLSQYAEKYKAETGNIWHSDETTLFIKKKGEQRYYQWVWNVMDAQTRYLLACQITENRFVEDAQKAMKAAKAKANRRPDAVVTDGLQAYRDAIKNEFYDPHALIANPHLRLQNFEVQPNNNILERLNGTFRERTKVMRSLDADLTAAQFLDGMRVYYNYIRPHQGIDGLTPAQMAGIPINLMGNRWEKMIGMAVK